VRNFIHSFPLSRERSHPNTVLISPAMG
jgi:hypothetical protein